MRTIPREVRNFKEIKSNFVLTQEQQAVLLGTLLGDGTLARRGREYRLHVKHGGKQLFFVKYKRAIFAPITSMPVRQFTQKVNQTEYHFAEFVTLTHPIFSDYYHLFYPEGKKVITPEVCRLTTSPQSLAIWFMDDGMSEYAGVSFNTQCFSLPEVDALRQMLAQTFKLDTSRKRNKNGWVIYIPKYMLPKFRELIEPYLLPQFLYKLEPYSEKAKISNPVETTRQRLSI